MARPDLDALEARVRKRRRATMLENGQVIRVSGVDVPASRKTFAILKRGPDGRREHVMTTAGATQNGNGTAATADARVAHRMLEDVQAQHRLLDRMKAWLAGGATTVKADEGADDGSRVQTLIFDREKFTVAEAKAWAAEHDFTNSEVDAPEGADSIRLRQFDPGDCAADSFGTVEMAPGIAAVVCVPKGTKDARRKADDEPPTFTERVRANEANEMLWQSTGALQDVIRATIEKTADKGARATLVREALEQFVEHVVGLLEDMPSVAKAAAQHLRTLRRTKAFGDGPGVGFVSFEAARADLAATPSISEAFGLMHAVLFNVLNSPAIEQKAQRLREEFRLFVDDVLALVDDLPTADVAEEFRKTKAAWAALKAAAEMESGEDAMVTTEQLTQLNAGIAALTQRVDGLTALPERLKAVETALAQKGKTPDELAAEAAAAEQARQAQAATDAEAAAAKAKVDAAAGKADAATAALTQISASLTTLTEKVDRLGDLPERMKAVETAAGAIHGETEPEGERAGRQAITKSKWLTEDAREGVFGSLMD